MVSGKDDYRGDDIASNLPPFAHASVQSLSLDFFPENSVLCHFIQNHVQAQFT